MPGWRSPLSGFTSADLIYGGANIVGTGQVVSHWRWLTAAFIHGGLLHILVNMWSLAQIGVLCEGAVGPGVIAAAYVITGTVGNIASTAFYGWRSHKPTISAGASGALIRPSSVSPQPLAWRTGQKGDHANCGHRRRDRAHMVLGMTRHRPRQRRAPGRLRERRCAHRPRAGAQSGSRFGRRLDGRARRRVGLPSSIAAFVVVRAYHGYH